MNHTLRVDPRPLERRRHQRVRLSLLGRFMLEDHREYPCQTIDVSPGGVALRAPVIGALGEKVIVYIEELGRMEGRIVRHVESGFAFAGQATRIKQEKLANQLTWLANRDVLGLSEDRSHGRVVPRRVRSVLKTDDGREHAARIVDVSRAGAAIETAATPPIGASVVIGRTPAKVSRHFDGGIGVEFNSPLVTLFLDEDVQL